MELTQLIFEVIAFDESVTTTEDLALCQVPIAREQPPVLPDHALDQHIVRDHLFVSRVIAEDAQPAREATEHRVGHKSRDRLIRLSKHVQGAEPPSADLSIMIRPESDSVDDESLTVNSDTSVQK